MTPSEDSQVLRVLLIAANVRLDGHEAARRHVLGLAEALADRADTSLTLLIGGITPERVDAGRYRILVRPYRSLIGHTTLASKVWRACRNGVRAVAETRLLLAESPDIVYERHSLASLTGALAAKLAHVPLVYEVNGVPDREIALEMGIGNPVVRTALHAFTTWHLRLADSIVVQSAELRDAMTSRYGVKELTVIPNGAERVPMASDATPGDPPVAVCIGTLDDLHDVTLALVALHASSIDLAVHVIGDGPQLPGLVDRLKGDSRFEFLGRLVHEEAMAHLRAADMALAVYSDTHPLFREYGFYFSPLKVFEYLANGKATVYLGPANQLVRQLHRAGALAATGDVTSFVSTVASLVSEPETRIGMGECARRVSHEFSWAAAAQRTRDLLGRQSSVNHASLSPARPRLRR